MTPIKPLDGGKHTGRSARDLTAFQWFAAMLLTGGKYPEGATLPGGKKVPGIPSDDVVDVANDSASFAGIIEYPGDVVGRPTTIITAGRVKLKMSGSGTAQDSIKVIAGGKGAKASADEAAIGYALEDWVDGQIAAFVVDRHIAKTRVAPPADDSAPPQVLNITPAQPFAQNVAGKPGKLKTLQFTVSQAGNARVGYTPNTGQMAGLTVVDSYGYIVGRGESNGDAFDAYFNGIPGETYTASLLFAEDTTVYLMIEILAQ